MSEPPLILVAEPAGDRSPPRPGPEPDTGLIGLVMLARLHNIAADADQLAHDFRESGKNLTVPQILLASKQFGLKARRVRTELSRLPQTPLPAMAIDLDGHFLVRPARAHSCGCKSHRKLITANEAKRNCMRVTECGEEA